MDRKEFDADLYSNFQNAFLYVQSKLNTEFIIKGGPREERLELPEEALREALLNAVAHRDYFVVGANILVEVFSDRVGITNPGGLVRGLKKKDLGKKSLSRNNLLFGLLQRMGLVEKVGSGIMRMQRAMKDYGLRGPDFEISDDWFTIVFRRPVVATQKAEAGLVERLAEVVLNERQRIFVEALKERKVLTRLDYEAIVKTSKRTAIRDLQDLVEKGIVVDISTSKTDPNRRYELA